MFSTGLTSLIVLLIFPPSITFFVFVHSWGSLDQPICKCVCLWTLIRTGWPILVELIDLLNSVIFFPSQMTTFLRWLTFLLGSQTVILVVLLFLIYFFLLMQVFVLQWLFLCWEILIMFLSQFPLTFHCIHNRIHRFTTLLMAILVLIGMVFVIIWEMLHERISLDSVLLLLLVNFRLELMCIPLIKSIRSSLTHLHGFQVLVLLP